MTDSSPPEPTTPAQVALVTCSTEQYADPEIGMVAAAVQDGGITADVVSWDDELDWGAYQLVVIRSTWDYFDRVTQFVEWAAGVERVTRLVNPADVIRWNAHKGYLAELGAKGIPTVPTTLIPAPSTDVADQIRECPWEELVVKPAVDGGARHAWRGRRDDPGLSRVAERLSGKGDLLVQPFVPAITDGERSLVFLGGTFSHAVRKVPKEGDYRSQRHLGGTEIAHEPDASEVQVALAAMEAAPGRLTYARIDLVEWEEMPCLIEMELIEPDLFFRDVPERLDRYVEVVREELRRPADPSLR